MVDNPVTRPLRVLVVDDRRDAVLVLKILITRAGHEVVTAERADDALNAAREFSPHVVISDLGLDGPMDGYALAQAMHDEPAIPNPQLIAVTGYDDEQHRQLAREAGFHHYLVKPASIDDLLAILTQVGQSAAGA
jgi:DNA-binding response OmpR family regulator